MIKIQIQYVSNSDFVDREKIPVPLLNAIVKLQVEHPEIANQFNQDLKEYELDKLFERLYNCRIEYNDHAWPKPTAIVWDNDVDYTLFLLKWS